MTAVADTIRGIVESIDPEAAAKSCQFAVAMRAEDEGLPVSRLSGLPDSVFQAAQNVRRMAKNGRMSSASLLNAVGAAAPSLVGLTDQSKAHGGAILASSPDLQSSLGGCFPSGEKGVDMQAALGGLLSAGLQSLPPQVQAAMQMAQIVAQAVSDIVAAIRFPTYVRNGSGFVVEGQEVACALDPTSPEHGSAPLAPGIGCLTVLYNGRPVWRAGLDVSKCLLPIHPPGYVQKAAKKTFVGGQTVARKTDKVCEGTGPRPAAKGAPKLSTQIPSTLGMTAETMLSAAASKVVSEVAQSTLRSLASPTPTPAPAPLPTPMTAPSPSMPDPAGLEIPEWLQSSLFDVFYGGLFTAVATAGAILLAGEGAMAAGAAIAAAFVIGMAVEAVAQLAKDTVIQGARLSGLIDEEQAKQAEAWVDAVLLIKTIRDIGSSLSELKTVISELREVLAQARLNKSIRILEGSNEWISAAALKQMMASIDQWASQFANNAAHTFEEFAKSREESIKGALEGLKLWTDMIEAGILNPIFAGRVGSAGSEPEPPSNSPHRSKEGGKDKSKKPEEGRGEVRPPDPNSDDSQDDPSPFPDLPKDEEYRRNRERFDQENKAAMDEAMKPGSGANYGYSETRDDQGRITSRSFTAQHPDGSIQTSTINDKGQIETTIDSPRKQ